jgi:hypothetical protein
LSMITLKLHHACSKRGIDQSLDHPACTAFPMLSVTGR